MASAKASVDLVASPDEVWQLIGGFGAIPDWVPGMSQAGLTSGGRIRHLQDPGGHTYVEQLESYDRAARQYSYSILQSPFAVTDYLATITVFAGDDGGCHVDWTATFTPVGVSESATEGIFRGIFAGALKNLSSRLTEQA